MMAGLFSLSLQRSTMAVSASLVQQESVPHPLASIACHYIVARHALKSVLLATDAGGDLVTLEANGTKLTHALQKGDSACFVSHKYHSIAPVLSGERQSLVVELWQGGIPGLGRS